MLEPLFNRFVGLQACNFTKKRLQHRRFSVNIANFESGGRGPGVGAGSRGSGGRKRAASINKVFSLAGGLSTGLSFYGV